MDNKKDIAFLNNLRSDIDSYLFLGYAPSLGTPGHDPDVKKMEEAMSNSKFQELRKRINEAKPRAIKLISRFKINAVYVQYPPPAVGGPIIEQHLLDIVTENITWRQISKTRIIDMIDQAIGALQLEQVSNKGSDSELDDKLNILKSSYLDNNLQHIINETITQGVPISFIMIDIDRFKIFNDKYGHLVGDDVLRVASMQISKIVGDRGKVIRFGGEEISVILPNYDIQEAIIMAERIRTTIEKYPFKVKDKEIARITVSAGISSSAESIEYKKLIDEADIALRVSKVKGRNQVNIFDKHIADLSDEWIIIHSVKDGKLKQHAEMALEAFKTEKIEDFAKHAKIAFDIAFYVWRKKYELKKGVIISQMAVAELIQNNILNFNLVDFTRFESFLPHITWFENGNYQITVKRSYALSNDKEAVIFCLKFFLDAIIEFKKQVDV
jgi:diguanylate cyclase (GGDEF)-like protein